MLELGCGTGRLSVPIAAAGVPLIGIDRSAEMLARAAQRQARRRRAVRPRRRGTRQDSLELVRGDMRFLPFDDAAFGMVFAPYGVLQSLVRDRDLSLALAEIRRVLAPGGVFGLDLVPDVPHWREYRDRVQFRGRLPGGAAVTLIESVHQDRDRFLTTFDQRFVVSSPPGRQVGGRRSAAGGSFRTPLGEHRFHLTFRTLPVDRMTGRLERAGFAVERVLGSYRGAAWHEGSDVWLVLARNVR